MQTHTYKRRRDYRLSVKEFADEAGLLSGSTWLNLAQEDSCLDLNISTLEMETGAHKNMESRRWTTSTKLFANCCFHICTYQRHDNADKTPQHSWLIAGWRHTVSGRTKLGTLPNRAHSAPADLPLQACKAYGKSYCWKNHDGRGLRNVAMLQC